MQCPYCNNEMKKGVISGDGRTKVRWCVEDEKIKFFDKLTNKGIIEAKYTLSHFQIESYYCNNCEKMIFDTKVAE